MGVPNEHWELNDLNSTFELCDTYPKILCVPRSMTNGEIIAASQFRSRNRLPALVFLHPKTKAPLVRCSQPLVGLNGKRGPEDENMVNLIRRSGKVPMLYVIDARPKANARANRTMGGGYEAMQAYESCQLIFMNIENIHRMRESLYSLFNLLKQGEAADRKGWLTALDETQWLKHIRTILAASCRVSRLLEEGHPVLTHCSDGWDRTPQITALGQLILDPYYRTLGGFAVLIEKEWISFGHKFAERMGHQEVDDGARPSSSDRSPIFLQFLDCVHQICRQYPCSFEFNEYLLVFLADESYTCRFGTFLLNSEKERQAKGVHERTVPVWKYIFLHRDKFVNPFFKARREPTFPSFSAKNVHLWEDFFLRWDSECVRQERTQDAMKYILDELQMARNQVKILEQASMGPQRCIKEVGESGSLSPVPTELCDGERPVMAGLSRKGSQTTDSEPHRQESQHASTTGRTVSIKGIQKTTCLGSLENKMLLSPATSRTSTRTDPSENQGIYEGLELTSDGNLVFTTELNRFSVLLLSPTSQQRKSDDDKRFLTDDESLLTSYQSSLKHKSTSIDDLDVPPTWIPDSWTRTCFLCTRPFSAINRKHHCRYCGNIFCGRCSSHKLAIPKFSYFKAVRVCDSCHTRLQRQGRNQDGSGDKKKSGDDSLYRLGLVAAGQKGKLGRESHKKSRAHVKKKPIHS